MSHHIPFVFSGSSITFQVNHKLYMIDQSNPSYEAAKAELKLDAPSEEKLIAFARPAEAVATQIAEEEALDRLPKGVLAVSGNGMTYNGEPLHGVLVERVIAMIAEGFNFMPLLRFTENLMQNPADFARDELYLWLETSNLPITEDGHFLAYKNVNGNFTSIHDSKTDNTPGTVVSMPRKDVDPNRDRTCSRGLHFCSKEYLPSFYTHGARTVVVKINPADVVSIPSDYNNTKGRAWTYLVLAEVDEDPQSKQWAAIVSADGGTFAPPAADAAHYSDPSDAPLDIGSDLAKALFAACNEIGLKDRDDRLDWAYEILVDGVDDPHLFSLGSFNDLTVGQATILLEAAREEAAEKDQTIEEEVAEAEAAARQAKVDAVNNYGIIALRRKASEAGLANAWKGYKATELRKFLIDQIK